MSGAGFSEDELLPISGLEHLLYCERQAALIHIEAVWSDNRQTAEGTALHERVHEAATEVRGGVRVARGLRLRSLTLGLSGMADVTEFYRLEETGDLAPGFGIMLPGTAGLWRPFPVEYKRGELRHDHGYEVQLCAQAICLEEMLDCHISEGAIYFGKTARRLAVAFEPSLREKTRAAASSFHGLVSSGMTPRANYGKKCPNCSLVEICLPRLGRGKSTTGYLRKALADIEEQA